MVSLSKAVFYRGDNACVNIYTSDEVHPPTKWKVKKFIRERVTDM